MSDKPNDKLYKLDSYGEVYSARCSACGRDLDMSMELQYSAKYHQKIFCCYKCAEAYCTADADIFRLYPADFKEVRLHVINNIVQ